MIIHGLSLDSKSRVTLPHDDYTKFLSGSNILYGIAHRHYLILSKEPLDGMGVMEFEIKTGVEANTNTHKILIPKDVIRLGMSVANNTKIEVIWVPHRMRDTIKFLLFFGEEGKKTWEKIRDTQSATSQILERLYQKSPN